MRQIVLAIVAVLVLSTQAQAWPDKWTWKDSVLQGIWTTTLAIDYFQTISSPEYPELNPILGKNASMNDIHIYTAATLFINFGISYVLPIPYRNWWQCFSIGWEGNTIFTNYNIGIRIHF